MSIQTINPTTNKVIESFLEMTEVKVHEAVEKASSAYERWKKTDYKLRAALLHKVAGLLRDKQDLLAKMITLEMGKLMAHAEIEIELSAEIIDYYANNAESFLDDKIQHQTHGQALIGHTPIGVLLGVEPWNFPLHQVARFAAPNIMIGNTIMAKHAFNVPQCGIAIKELFKEEGAPVGLYTNILISGIRASTLVADKRINGVSQTGSEAAGASIALEAGKHLEKSVLELEGNDAFILLDDVDMDKTVEWAVIGRINNNGQCCVTSKSIIVMESVADVFLEKFKTKLSQLIVDDPMDATTQLGPMSSEAAVELKATQVQKSVDGGATILLGGKWLQREGAFMEPTIITNMQKDNPFYYKELFGSLPTFFRIKDEQASIDLANDSPYGLAGSLFPQDIERGKWVADQIDTSMVFINHPTWTQADLTFGGTKRFGYGRELSELGINEFVNKKLIRVSELSDPF